MEGVIKQTRVLIVDHSAVMRKFLCDCLNSSRRIDVVGTAPDPYVAAHKINTLQPDVVILDIVLPRVDGFVFLGKLMKANPMPVIMSSDNSEDSARDTIRSLELGAHDFILKPAYEDISQVETLKSFSARLIDTVISASEITVAGYGPAGEVVVDDKPKRNLVISSDVIAIGASAGGVNVISEILSRLPENMPGIIISQHMPEGFTKAFAERLNEISSLHVSEAENQERLYNGSVLVSPGNRSMLLRRDNAGFFVELSEDIASNRYTPSVDRMLSSVAEAAGARAVGIILTGMGDDGAQGLLEMRKEGAVTVAQDEASSAVFGMPMKAIEMGACEMIKSIDEIVEFLLGHTV